MGEYERIYRLKDFDDLSEELDFLLGSYYKSRRPVLMSVEKGWRPPTDMYETAKEIVITVDIAGVTTRDVSLKLDGNSLTIRGVRHGQNCGKRQYHSMEIDYGMFERRLELPVSIDPDGIKARFVHGFLEIRLIKMDRKPTGRKNIEIK